MFHYSRSRFFRKGYPELRDRTYLIAAVFIVCTHAIKIGRVFLPLIANILFISINFTLKKVSVTFFVQMNVQNKAF